MSSAKGRSWRNWLVPALGENDLFLHSAGRQLLPAKDYHQDEDAVGDHYGPRVEATYDGLLRQCGDPQQELERAKDEREDGSCSGLRQDLRNVGTKASTSIRVTNSTE